MYAVCHPWRNVCNFLNLWDVFVWVAFWVGRPTFGVSFIDRVWESSRCTSSVSHQRVPGNPNAESLCDFCFRSPLCWWWHCFHSFPVDWLDSRLLTASVVPRSFQEARLARAPLMASAKCDRMTRTRMRAKRNKNRNQRRKRVCDQC